MDGSIATTAPWTSGPSALQPVEGGLLGGRVDRQHDVAALGGVAVDQVDQPVDEQPVVLTGEEAVLGALDAGLVAEGVPAGDRRRT